ncbi:MAG: lipoprotein insertase outer membrane protein LolB [Halioglobus sp.]
MASTPKVNLLAFATLMLFLAGCATQTSTVVPDSAWEQRRATLTELDEFKADGKIALRTSERSDSASMIWVQSGGSSYVNLSGPLGTGATNLRSDGKTVTITRNGEVQTYSAEDYESLDDFGIPVGTIGYWARGIPDPALPIDDIAVTDNLLQSLVQSGWTITYTGYDHFGSYTLPTRLQLSKGSSVVTIFLYDWSLPVVQ